MVLVIEKLLRAAQRVLGSRTRQSSGSEPMVQSVQWLRTTVLVSC